MSGRKHPIGWENSNRESRLPANWHKLRARVKRRDGGLCKSCGRPGTQVDHIIRGDNHALENLQLLCEPCHTRKTQAESAEARRAQRPRREISGRPGFMTEPMPDYWSRVARE
ncbi:HNH endonuclease [Streptomyces sp. NPDC021020]|uniref:HNH endonuclease n=1 Tax=Streptomyces sp. NPDC021020 TaxID=3365109 RepID=UPI0037904BB6